MPTIVGGRPLPTRLQLVKAHQRMEEAYSDPFYRVATELIELAGRGQTRIKVSDALATVLLTWNQSFYRFNPELRPTLVTDLNGLLRRHKRLLTKFRATSIKHFGDDNEDEVRAVFEAFDDVLRPVGAAKALHLLAPRFFPLWDTRIAKAYVGNPSARSYMRFIEIVQMQCERLGGERVLGRGLLRSLDEFNYCRYTKDGWA